MIPLGTLDPAACPGCGTRCDSCGDRMCATFGPAPAPRCPDHPTCPSCADTVIHCRECGEVLRKAAEDRAEQVAFDAMREAL